MPRPNPNILSVTFATLWLLPFLPAFGPGLNNTSWYRLILRKEDQRPSTHRGVLWRSSTFSVDTVVHFFGLHPS
ncbi:hypothetical protein ASPVEDRAFT_35632 [Aspergillus versicolor CBS 583.65]|uniref:Secreted protein n=1 Tax=Aspergillus versicolor CBS 583.65 TaxID=1036611 RepID=A0A1L9P418_ASPVE|nr:uncharacterized protein ASPVEDRAFT_35632 [Aspergillus versicolor CBS 583.65]OJI96270.1 hypothetical protein ASPVEDRAFT_35632 [Aspergillus versicolor CBS 583.65]